MNSYAERLEISRLIHRFGMGPKPGEFAQLVQSGVSNARTNILTPSATDAGLAKVAEPDLRDLGPRPQPNTPQVIPFANSMRKQNSDLLLWWLDRMVLADNALTERMTWFWHGHWATSIGKVEYALPMKIQNATLRNFALGNFADMSRAMVQDGALQYWLDGNQNQKGAPNENLARELMELFTLGVNHYTEDDIKNLAKALTGYSVTRSSGKITFDTKKHDATPISFLGKTASFDAISASDYLVSRDDCAAYITSRLWFRFISSLLPNSDQNIISAFAGRDILKAVTALASHPAMSDPVNSQVKSPIDWFVSVCRALQIVPSQVKVYGQIANYLDKLGQVPFIPPNVGGWPYDEAWLNVSSAQYRLAFAGYLVSIGNLSPLKNSTVEPAQFLADWLGVARWSSRTKTAFASAQADPARLTLLAISAPEYLVNG